MTKKTVKDLNIKTRLKRGDTVIVQSGRSKGAKGKILSIDRQSRRVIVEGVNMVTKHMKANRQNQTGGIVKKESPIHISNVCYLHKGVPTRIGYKIITDASGVPKKIRIAKKTNEEID